jgi:Cu(I)/Ag(I) efflux system membrane fusion protein
MTSLTTKIFILALLLGLAVYGRGAAAETKPPDVDYYTCTMHPSVRAEAPGKCPICGMELVPVKMKGVERGATPQASDASRSNTPRATSDMQDMPGMVSGEPKGAEKPGEFVVPVERQQQIGVTYATVARAPLQKPIRAVGIVEPDRQRLWAFVARVAGYLQQLFVTSPGEMVEKDAPLLSIYSPDLATTERELVMLLEMRDRARSPQTRETPASLIAAAKARLRQWNVTDEQIAELEKQRRPNDVLTLRSPFRGVVQKVTAEQGGEVKLGDNLVEVVDLSVVWLWAELYENEIAAGKIGAEVSVTAASFPGEKFSGRIAVINPFLDEMKRTMKVRIDIPNPDFKLRPGMYANAELSLSLGEALVIPISAVMPTGQRNIVFVDKGAGRIEPRVVQLGAQAADRIAVIAGLTIGERVVSSANFLIDAESKLQGALKDFAQP